MKKQQKARAHLARAQELIGQGTLAFGGMKSRWEAEDLTRVTLMDPGIDGINPEPCVFEDHKGLRLAIHLPALNENQMAAITAEVQILQRLSKTSRNIMQIDKFTILDERIDASLVLAYENADLPLYDYCHNDTYPFSSDSTTRMYISHEIANGLAELHAKSWIHGNLAVRNVSVTNPDSKFPIIKLFNVSLPVCKNLIFHEGHSLPTHENYYLEHAPERITEDDYTSNAEADIYRLGMVMYYICHKTRPWSNVQHLTTIIESITSGERPPINLDYNQISTHKQALSTLEQVIKDCWHQDPARRPTVQAIVEKLGNYAKHVPSLLEREIYGRPQRHMPSIKKRMTGPYVRQKG